MDAKTVSVNESSTPFELVLDLIRGGMFGDKVCVTFEKVDDQEKLQYTITDGTIDTFKLLELLKSLQKHKE